VTGALAGVLRQHRDEINARWRSTRIEHPAVDDAAFGEHLARVVAPLTDLVEAAAPGSAGRVGPVLVALSVEAFAAGLLGPTARRPAAARVWADVASSSPAALADEPRRLVASLTNAAVAVDAADPAAVDPWADLVAGVGARCSTTSAMLDAGLVAAWFVGLAHLRPAALEAIDGLPAGLLAMLAGRDPSSTDEAALAARLRADPWFDPRPGARPSPPSGEVVARPGGLRALGGPFGSVPVVVHRGDDLVVTAGGERWLLWCDAFGTVVRGHPGSGSTSAPASRRWRYAGPVELDGGAGLGRPADEPLAEALDWPDEVTSIVTDGRVLVVSSQLSHRLWVVARRVTT
jgi:hypothetical protein